MDKNESTKDEPIEEEFELKPISPPEVSGGQTSKNYWKHIAIFTSVGFLGLFFYLIANGMNTNEASRSLTGDISSASGMAFQNIFRNGGAGSEKEELLETIDLNKIESTHKTPKNKKTISSTNSKTDKPAKKPKDLAMGSVIVEAVTTPPPATAQEPSHSPEPAPSPEPVPTPVPTPMPTPTATPEPNLTPTPEVTPTPSEINNKNIIINEILFNPEGGDKGKEFVELYNPNDSDINLKDYALRFSQADETSTSSLGKIGSSNDDKTIIKAKGFFLIGLNGYEQTPQADIKRSASLTNTAGKIYLNDASGKTLETVSYSDAIPEGQSLERESPESQTFRNNPNPIPKNSL